MSMTDLAGMRFAYSPLAEVAESLWMISSGRVRPPYRGWFEAIRGRLRRTNLRLLTAVVPARPMLARFLFTGGYDPTRPSSNSCTWYAPCRAT